MSAAGELTEHPSGLACVARFAEQRVVEDDGRVAGDDPSMGASLGYGERFFDGEPTHIAAHGLTGPARLVHVGRDAAERYTERFQ